MDAPKHSTPNAEAQASGWTLPGSIADAAQEPWRYGFVSTVRHLAARHAHLPLIGHAPRAQLEPFRLGQQASMVFAPREIAEIRERSGLPLIRLFGLGMLGPNGPLPIHMTEWVRERSQGHRDDTMANFLDMFHHRYLTLFYRAWAQAQSAVGLDRTGEETFTPYVARLAGDEVNEVSGAPLPPHARWASAAHRVRQARNPEGLASTLSRYFGVVVQLHEYQLQWVAIEPADVCRIGMPHHSSKLGQGALLGEVLPDRQHRFRLTIGPMTLRQYLRFTPQGAQDGSDVEALIEWVRAFVSYEYAWEIILVLRRDEVPPARLGGEQRLGWSTWMGETTSGDSVTGMSYEPESNMNAVPQTPDQEAQ